MPAVGDISFTDEAAKPIQLTLAKMTGPDFDTLREIVMAKVEEALKKIIKTTPQIILPPSAAVAGAYARTDLERGVWKAPANVPLNAVERVETVITDADQGLMNDKGINVIRTFTGQGTIIWGARTLDATSDLWRYIPLWTEKKGYLYAAIQHYFEVGGDHCFVLSVDKRDLGNWNIETIELVEKLEAAALSSALSEESSITLMSMPDLALLDEAGTPAQWATVYKAMLDTCKKHNWFAVLDSPNEIEDAKLLLTQGNFGIYAEYGAAYWPHLKSLR
ncbi:hypothetical protein BGZ92_007190 [Podila epicladia]|nr:hypothetical protein BGZ92_007190 [Podila epicladia]